MKESINNFNPRKLALFACVLLALLLTAAGGAAHAQEGGARAQEPEAQRERQGRREQQARRERQGRRGAGGLLRALNLTTEQRTQIRAIRRETEAQGPLLGMRLMQARRALDEAIYSDNSDDRIIEERVREVGAAQVAALRMRTLTELKIRRVLTPEQLNVFRRLQRQPRMRRGMNQTSTQDDFPGAIAPDDAGNSRRRRNRERQP